MQEKPSFLRISCRHIVFLKNIGHDFYGDNDDQKYPLRDAVKIKFQDVGSFL